jgi:hypothetical protein
MPAEQKKALIEQQTGTFFRGLAYAAPPIVMIIIFLLGGLIYWLGANAMGGSATFMRGVSVWVYSSFPPAIVSMLANILILFLKSVDDIDINTSGWIAQAESLFLINARRLGSQRGSRQFEPVIFYRGMDLAAIGLSVAG